MTTQTRLPMPMNFDQPSIRTAGGEGVVSGLAVGGFITAFFVPFVGFWLSVFSFADIRNGNRSGMAIATWGTVFSILGVLTQLALAFIFVNSGIASLNEFATTFSEPASVPVP
ncbi:hypothetical protein [Mycetocola sp. 2940]|uniref:hypothetical protein n=1 Tax=Mycetocola sp. 2940 TaxID=3156452 RepID=UPI003392A079